VNQPALSAFVGSVADADAFYERCELRAVPDRVLGCRERPRLICWHRRTFGWGSR